MPSNAISAQGSVISINTGTTAAPVWTPIRGVISFSGFDGAAPDIDVTDLDSTAMEFRSGLQDMGNFNMDINVVRTDPGQVAVEAARTARTVKSFKLTLPAPAGGGAAPAATFDALVKSTPLSGGVNAALKGSISTKITGPVTWA